MFAKKSIDREILWRWGAWEGSQSYFSIDLIIILQYYFVYWRNGFRMSQLVRTVRDLPVAKVRPCLLLRCRTIPKLRSHHRHQAHQWRITCSTPSSTKTSPTFSAWRLPSPPMVEWAVTCRPIRWPRLVSFPKWRIRFSSRARCRWATRRLQQTRQAPKSPRFLPPVNHPPTNDRIDVYVNHINLMQILYLSNVHSNFYFS